MVFSPHADSVCCTISSKDTQLFPACQAIPSHGLEIYEEDCTVHKCELLPPLVIPVSNDRNLLCLFIYTPETSLRILGCSLWTMTPWHHVFRYDLCKHQPRPLELILYGTESNGNEQNLNPHFELGEDVLSEKQFTEIVPGAI